MRLLKSGGGKSGKGKSDKPSRNNDSRERRERDDSRERHSRSRNDESPQVRHSRKGKSGKPGGLRRESDPRPRPVSANVTSAEP